MRGESDEILTAANVDKRRFLFICPAVIDEHWIALVFDCYLENMVSIAAPPERVIKYVSHYLDPIKIKKINKKFKEQAVKEL